VAPESLELVAPAELWRGGRVGLRLGADMLHVVIVEAVVLLFV
jgi:hypothetical protein